MTHLCCQVAELGEAERADRMENYEDGDEKSPCVPLPGKLKVPPPISDAVDLYIWTCVVSLNIHLTSCDLPHVDNLCT